MNDEHPRNDAPGANWREYSGSALPPLLQAALDCFVEQGYHGTTIRTVAARAGLSVPGLYHHYKSKQTLLVAIVQIAMRDLLVRSEAAIAEAGTSIEDQFRLIIECLTLYHAHRRELAFISSSEIRSLHDEARAEHIAARDKEQRIVDRIVEEGVKSGLFATDSPREVSRAVVTMCTGVSQWYRQDGGLSPEELATKYVEIARASLGYA